MAKLLTKLTPEQEAQIPAIRDEFLRIGLSTEPADFDAAEQAARDAYAVAGLPAPELFIRLASPMEGAIGAAILKGTRIGESVWDQVGAQVWAQVRDQVRDQVGAQVRAQVWAQVGDQVRDQVGDQLRDTVYNSLYAQHDAGFGAWVTFFRDVCGWTNPALEKFEVTEALIKSCGWTWWHENVLAISDRPSVLHRDENNRLHCETGPAIAYRDGWSIYYWHGVSVPAEWIEKRATLDPAEVLKSENVEQRAAGAAIIGWPKMVSRLKRKVIDGDPDTDMGALIELTLPGLREPGRFLQAICVRNGTIVEGIPRVSDIDGKPIETALAAQAWRVGLTQTEYRHPVHRT